MKLITKILIPAVLVGLIAGGAAFFIASNKNKEPEINQSALYIGIPKSQDGQDVVLHISVDSASGKGNKEYYSSDLKPLEGQDENLVFLNYASDPVIPLDGKEIGYWLNDSNNSIKVQTILITLASIKLEFGLLMSPQRTVRIQIILILTSIKAEVLIYD